MAHRTRNAEVHRNTHRTGVLVRAYTVRAELHTDGLSVEIVDPEAHLHVPLNIGHIEQIHAVLVKVDVWRESCISVRVGSGNTVNSVGIGEPAKTLTLPAEKLVLTPRQEGNQVLRSGVFPDPVLQLRLGDGEGCRAETCARQIGNRRTK